MLSQFKYSILFFLLFFAIPAAANEDVYTVSNVEVYGESDNLDNARREAMNKGIVESFHLLMKRLMPVNSHWKIDSMKEAQALDLMKEYKVVKERMTAYTYLATLDISYDPTGVKTLMNRMGVTYAEEFSKVNLVVPVLQRGNDFYLWGKDNWSKAWGEIPAEVGLSKFAFALGDLRDLEIVEPVSVLHEPYAELDELLKRHSAENLIVVYAKDKGEKLEVAVRFVNQDRDFVRHQNYDISPNETTSQLYKRVSQDLIYRVDAQWKGTNAFDEIKIYKTPVTVNVSSPREWSIIRKKLGAIQQIQEVNIRSAALKQVSIELIYNIEPVAMSELLAENRLIIADDGGDLSLTLAE